MEWEGEAGEGVSASDFSSRPRVALVTVCHPGINNPVGHKSII